MENKERNLTSEFIASIIILVLSLIILIPAGLCISGYIIMVLWNWFIVPLGMIKLNFGMAVGIDVFLSMIFFPINTTLTLIKTKVEERDPDKSLITTVVSDIAAAFVLYLIIKPVWFLVIGYFVKLLFFE